MLRALGHTAVIVAPGLAPRCDLLIALHALRSAASVERARELRPRPAIAVALTGTDLYRDIHDQPAAQRSLELADLLITLHPGAAGELPKRLRAKVRLVPQSAPRPSRPLAPLRRWFEVAVVGHLRAEKDPLRTALAARQVGPGSRVKVVHAGAALSLDQGAAALAEMRQNPRYRWLGELTRARSRALIARARILCITSVMEGGANVLSEAVAAGTPVLASRIPAMVALLGSGYPGLFALGDTSALAALLRRAESEPGFLADLRRRCLRLRASLSPARETSALRALVREVAARR